MLIATICILKRILFSQKCCNSQYSALIVFKQTEYITSTLLDEVYSLTITRASLADLLQIPIIKSYSANQVGCSASQSAVAHKHYWWMHLIEADSRGIVLLIRVKSHEKLLSNQAVINFGGDVCVILAKVCSFPPFQLMVMIYVLNKVKKYIRVRLKMICTSNCIVLIFIIVFIAQADNKST